MRKVLFTACAVGLAVVSLGGLAQANETSWAITFTASSGSDFNPASDSGAKAIAVASTLSGVQDDSSIRDTRDGVPPAGTQGAPAHAAWYRPTWMKNDGTDSTSFPWAFGNDYKQPLSGNYVKEWPDLIVWTAPGFINNLTPGDTSDDRSVVHLLLTTTTPSNTAPNSINGQPVRYKLIMAQAPAGYVPGANGSTMPTGGDGTPGNPYEFLLPAVPDASAAVGGKLLIADLLLPVAGTEAANPISGTGPLTATQTAGYRFNFVTPEPGSMLVLASGLTGLLGLVSRRRKA